MRLGFVPCIGLKSSLGGRTYAQAFLFAKSPYNEFLLALISECGESLSPCEYRSGAEMDDDGDES
jgi:hypothetical protein